MLQFLQLYTTHHILIGLLAIFKDIGCCWCSLLDGCFQPPHDASWCFGAWSRRRRTFLPFLFRQDHASYFLATWEMAKVNCLQLVVSRHFKMCSIGNRRTRIMRVFLVWERIESQTALRILGRQRYETVSICHFVPVRACCFTKDPDLDLRTESCGE